MDIMKELPEGHEGQKFLLTQIISKVQLVGLNVLDTYKKLNSNLP